MEITESIWKIMYIHFWGSAAASGEKKGGRPGNGSSVYRRDKWTADMLSFYQRCDCLFMDAAAQEHIEFTDVMWQQIHEDAEKYFEGEEIVGWFFAQRQMVLEITELFCKIHLQAFRRRKSADADGTRKTKKLFFIMKTALW